MVVLSRSPSSDSKSETYGATWSHHHSHCELRGLASADSAEWRRSSVVEVQVLLAEVVEVLHEVRR